MVAGQMPVWGWLVVLVVVAIAIYLLWPRGKACTTQDDCGEGSDLVCKIPSGATKGRCVHTGSPVV